MEKVSKFASSFRNGSGAVATALSTLHGNHQWEGIALKPSERLSYKNDSTCFASKFLVGIDIDDGVNKFTDDNIEVSLRNDIMDEIKPFTLRQGKIVKLEFVLFNYKHMNSSFLIFQELQIGIGFANLA